MTRNEALKLLHTHIKNENLRRHCYAVEASMRGLYRRLVDGAHEQREEDKWGIAGLLHDADYEETKENAKKEHTKRLLEWLDTLNAETDIRDAIASHAWNYVDGAPEPKTQMQWALYCCDELTGLIVAVALVKPEKRLSSVTVESVLNKWSSKSFAAGVDRSQIEKCEDMLGIPLRDFIETTLASMQVIHEDLGL